MKFNVSDYLTALDNQPFGKHILYIPTSTSTNDEIWMKFTNDDHLLIISDKQTAGRGQRGNEWISKEYQSLTFSLGLIDDNINSSLLSLKCAIAISRAIKSSTGISTSIKWPNDILINNKKVAGILIESKKINNKEVLNIGIGINVNLDIDNIDQELKSTITSLNIEANQQCSREIILAECIKSLDSLLYKDNQLIINDWIQLCGHINKELSFHHCNKKIKGIFTGIDKNGRAMIKNNGKTNFYFSGILEY